MGDGSAIAIVGMSCRVPMAGDPVALWELLLSGSSAIREAPDDRLRLADSGIELAPGARCGGFLDQIDRFDCEFFGISPREAALMDPQQRLMLELCWEALEDAVVRPGELKGSQTGVFVGSISSDYADLLRERGAEAMTRHALTGLHRSLIANRVSYTLGLRGPSMTMDTGQSSSLVAVHVACESLRRGESTLALACGVHLNISSSSALSASSFGGLSPDGRCFTFDARANGYVRGEGGGVVVLKTLSEAIAAGDSIYGVIRASAVNNDGGGDSLTAPSQLAQEEVLRRAYRKSGLKRGEIQYVELHGSATKLGDRVEAGALGAVLGAKRPREDPLIVGSIKTNIGHLEGAAGIVGLIKAALCIQHRKIPPSLNFHAPPSEIPLDALGLKVQQTLDGWPSEQGSLCAGVSSFGVGGTNCHVVLAEPPSLALSLATGRETGKHDGLERKDAQKQILAGEESVWLLSAHGEASLREQAARLADRVDGDVDLAVGDVAHTLAIAKQAFNRRALVIGEDRQTLLEGLRDLAQSQPATDVVEGLTSSAAKGGPVFVFPGQGSQWEGMAVELLDGSPVFAERIDACAEALAEHVDWSLVDVLRGVSGAPGLDRIEVVQPALFAVMVSLADLWRASGVEPAGVVGHSQGEIAAAYVAGGLSLEDSIRVVALRSRVLRSLVGRGGVLSIAASVDWVQARLERWGERITIGGKNGPRSVGVVGDREALLELLGECEREGVRAREVQATVASHSPQVESLRAELLEVLAGISPRSGEVPFYSTVLGGPLDTAELGPEYWYRNTREPVQFESAVRSLLAHAPAACVEISPHPVLAVAVGEIVEATSDEREREIGEIAVLSTLRRDQGGPRRFLHALGEAWVNGVDVDWDVVASEEGSRRVRLPTYPFQRGRHWLESGTDVPDAPDAAFATSAPQVVLHDDTVPAQVPFEGRVPAQAPLERRVPSQASLERRLREAPEVEREAIVIELVRSHVARILGHAGPEGLDVSCAFKEARIRLPLRA